MYPHLQVAERSGLQQAATTIVTPDTPAAEAAAAGATSPAATPAAAFAAASAKVVAAATAAAAAAAADAQLAAGPRVELDPLTKVRILTIGFLSMSRTGVVRAPGGGYYFPLGNIHLRPRGPDPQAR